MSIDIAEAAWTAATTRPGLALLVVVLGACLGGVSLLNVELRLPGRIGRHLLGVVLAVLLLEAVAAVWPEKAPPVQPLPGTATPPQIANKRPTAPGWGASEGRGKKAFIYGLREGGERTTSTWRQRVSPRVQPSAHPHDIFSRTSRHAPQRRHASA